jgi:lipopolysaccharide export system protein LptC
MRDTRKLVLALVLAAIAASTWWFTRDAALPTGTSDVKARQDPDYIVEKYAVRAMNEQGSPHYTLTAQRLTHYPHDDTAHFIEPVLVRFQPNGARVTTRADTGVMPGDAREIVMNGNVHTTQAGDPRSVGGEMRAERMRIQLDRP